MAEDKKPAGKKAPVKKKTTAKKTAAKPAAKKAAAKKPAAKKAAAKTPAAKKTAAKPAAKKTAAKPAAKKTAAKKPAAKKTAAKPAAKKTAAKPAAKKAAAKKPAAKKAATKPAAKKTAAKPAAKKTAAKPAAKKTAAKPAAKKAATKPAAKKAAGKKAAGKKATGKKESTKAPAKKASKKKSAPKAQAPAKAPAKESKDAAVPVPGQVIDLRGSRGRGKPVPAKTTPRPAQSTEGIVVPEVGGVIDFRAKREESKASEGRSSGKRGNDRKEKRGDDRKEKRGDDRKARGSRPAPQKDVDGNKEPRGASANEEESGNRREKPPAKDITVVVMGLHGMIDTALSTIEAIHTQKLPWEVEVLVMAPKGRFEFPDARIFKPRNVNNVPDVMDYALQRANSDMVVFINGNVVPQGEKWLIGLTDPMFEESSVGIVDCPVVGSGRDASKESSKTFHRHDTDESRFVLSGSAFAVRKSVALKNKFDAGEGTREDWTERVLASGFTRRYEASVAVEEVKAAPAAPAKTEEKKKAPSKEAKPAQKARPAREEPRRKKVVPPTPAMHPEEAPPLWQLPMQIGQRTAEKYLQIAMDKKQRTLTSVILAPVNATREVLGTYRKGGLPIPSILTKDD